MATALAFKTVSAPYYLGPARVLEVSGDMALVQTPQQRVWSRIALGFVFSVTPDDVVLTISNDESWYVIGILEHSGRATITVPGDLEVTAPNGRIDLKSSKGISVQSATVRIGAVALDVVSRTVRERFGRATRWVKEGLQLRAGRARTVVESDYRVSAGKIVERAKGSVRIDGQKIDLG